MVSIVILSYNTSSYLAECLSSVYKNVRDLPFEIIVVDNNSTDNSVHMVKTKFSKVRLIESEENLGFAKGVNLGVKHAKGEWVLLLNSDTRVHENSIEKLVGFAKENQEVAVVGGKLKNRDGSTSSSYSSFYTPLRIFLFLFWPMKKEKTLKDPKAVDWVSGGFMLIKKEIFDKVHGFDPHFFMYIEDMELCYRLKKSGYKVYYYPKAIVEHVGQGSSNRTFAIIQIYKGLLYFYKKHRSYEYPVVKALLFIKALVSLSAGYLKNDDYLTTTYSEVFRKAL